jgi:DNA modification methylase
MASPEGNVLYYGDNLDVLRQHVATESVDLVYLDPPFNSNANYNVLFAEQDGSRSAAQIKAFTDTWRWDEAAAAAYHEAVEAGGDVSRAMQAFRTILGDSNMLAYLAMMAPRLVELHRVLKRTGSLYLHCDPTASHYLKLLMDAVFGPENFRNEIIWHYRKWSTGKYAFQRNHDVLLFYSRSGDKARVFNQLFMERAASTLKRFGTARIVSGHDEAGHRVPSQIADEDSEGVRQDDVWEIGRVPPIKQLFPTEKPPLLLERIIGASTKEGDVVLDPFCGCGTTIVAAEQLKRRWLGIDITALATSLIKGRLKDAFNESAEFKVVGEPVSVEDAAELANSDPYQFQWWALGLVGARPADEKKGADKGIDGRIYFHDEGPGGKTKQIILSVKAGKTGAAHVRDLVGTMEREKADMGALLTFQTPTKAMKSEAVSAGFYHSPGWQAGYLRVQIITVAELLDGAGIHYPHQTSVTFKKAPKATASQPAPASLWEGAG